MAFLEWQNLVFLLPMAAGMLYIALMVSGISGGEHDVDVDHDLAIEHDFDVDQDLAVEQDVAVEHDLDAGHDVPDAHMPAAHAHHFPWLGKTLGFLGVGKVPISILMISGCFTWGAAGLVFKAILGPDAMLRVAGLAAVTAVVGTRLIAEGLGAILPGDESYYTPKKQLVGEVGQVLYEVTPISGTVRLRDPSGNLLDLDCRACGEERIASGAQVVLQEYDASSDLFFVRTSV